MINEHLANATARITLMQKLSGYLCGNCVAMMPALAGTSAHTLARKLPQ